MTRFGVALGSNLGDRVTNLRTAVAALGSHGEVLAVSGLYETAPIGGPDQGPFLNAVVVLDSSLAPETLLDRLLSIEKERGRERTVRWGPRTLDLDLVATEGRPVDTARLQIPHPRAVERRFVLEPLLDVWPDAVVAPVTTVAAAREATLDQEVELLARRWLDPSAPHPGRYWVLAQIVLFVAIAVILVSDGTLPRSDPGSTAVIGGALLVVGLVLALVSARTLGAALTAVPEPVPGARLVEGGMYAHARHPIYGGVVLVLLGTSMLLDSLIAAVLSLGMLGFLWAKSSYEEKQLRMAYPGYWAYRRRVRKRLIPFVI